MTEHERLCNALLTQVTAHLTLNYPNTYAVFDNFDDMRYVWNDGHFSEARLRNADMTDFVPGELLICPESDHDSRFSVQYTLNPALLEHCNEESRPSP